MGLSAFLVIAMFQNCAQEANSLPNPNTIAINDSKTIAEETLMSTKDFVHVSRYLDRYSGTSPFYVFVNLNLGTVAYQFASQTSYFTYCEIDSARKQLLQTVLQTSKICRYSQIENPEFVHCQAIATRDLVISTADGKIQELAKPLCGQGEDLCGVASDALRDILDDLSLNKPDGC